MQSISKVAVATLELNNKLLSGWRRMGVIKSGRVLMLMMVACSDGMG